MTRKHHGRIIDTSIRLEATPMQAWEAWADPQQIANWFVDRAEGRAEPGGTMKWFFEAFNFALDVPIVEAEPGRTFVTGGGPESGPDGLPYLMEITIEQEGDHTVMNLVNSGFSEDPEKDGSFNDTVSGWQCALATMKVWMERYPSLKRKRTIVMRPASHSPEQLRALYATTAGRQKWLTPDLPADGAVIVDSGTEVILDWPSEQAVIGLKSFGMGPQQMVALDLSVWSGSVPETTAAGATADREARMNRALDRLVALV